MNTVGSKKLVGTLAALACLAATAGSANAFVEGRHRQFNEAYGNNNVYGAVTYTSTQDSSNGTKGVTLVPGPGWASVPYLDSSASQAIDTSAKLFGIKAKPIVGSISAQAHWELDANDDSDQYSQLLSANLTVLGSTVYHASGHTCDTGKRCFAATRHWDRTFLEGSQTFWFWAVPVSVHGVVSGTASADLAAEATAIPLNGERWTLDGMADAYWTVGAALITHFDSCVGLCGGLAIGVTADFRVFEFSFGPHAQSAQQTRLNGDAHYSWINRASLAMTTMRGKASLWADYLFGHAEATIVDTDGYSRSWKLWGNSGSNTCTGFRNRSGECYDVR
jgi:hypothetical protein